MKTPFVIYCRAVGLYALLTLPVILSPDTYLLSLLFVLIFGWFALVVFTLLYVIINYFLSDFVAKVLSLFIAVVIAVAFAYQMLGLLAWRVTDLWHTIFIFFPFIAIVAGWISVCFSREAIRDSGMAPEQADIVA